MRKLVSVREVQSIAPIEGADKIEKARVDGWIVVVGKDDYKPGDKAIFFEIDSALPLEGVFSFLSGRSPKRSVNGVVCHVLRTAKLRGVLSQGLLMKPEDFGITDISVGDDLTEWMEDHHGVTKWEAPLPAAGRGQQAGSFPSHLIRKTDSERIQNLISDWDKIKSLRWRATEKVDGTSATYVMTEDGLIACSRNWAIKEGDNLYWRIAERYALSENMPVGSALQGEIYGESINGNRLGMSGQHFAYFYSSEPEGGWMTRIPSVSVFPFLYLPDTPEEAIAQANGIKSLIAPNRLAEGIVWHYDSYKDGDLDFLGGRPNFKVINNKYLLKEK